MAFVKCGDFQIFENKPNKAKLL